MSSEYVDGLIKKAIADNHSKDSGEWKAYSQRTDFMSVCG